jgi:hypothetical protein
MHGLVHKCRRKQSERGSEGPLNPVPDSPNHALVPSLS